MLLTKLDEAARLGGLLSLLRDSRLPISYLADGQNVPDDIRPADPGRLARMILGLDTIYSEPQYRMTNETKNLEAFSPVSGVFDR